MALKTCGSVISSEIGKKLLEVNERGNLMDMEYPKVSPPACECGLPELLLAVFEDVSFESSAWMTRVCPQQAGICCLRRAALKAVFRD